MADGASEQIELAPGVSVDRAVVRFVHVRSGGPGGQAVNKLATKAQLRIHLDDIPINAGARRRLVRLAGRRVNRDGELVISAESERSQRGNRAACLARLREMLVEAMVKPKVRRKTRPSKGAVERRLKEKREQGERKQRRRGIED